jgi:protein-S-isoprenylcysteine O-methyltransferase Ste14
MIAKHLGLTAVVGAASGVTLWTHPSAAWTAVQVLGLCLLVFGFVFWSVARFQLGNAFTVAAQATQLVTQGIYSKIRNPIYIFGSMAIAGLVLALGRPIWLLIFAVVVPLQLWRAHKEAQVLEEKFGEEYRSYRAGTWF